MISSRLRAVAVVAGIAIAAALTSTATAEAAVTGTGATASAATATPASSAGLPAAAAHTGAAAAAAGAPSSTTPEQTSLASRTAAALAAPRSSSLPATATPATTPASVTGGIAPAKLSPTASHAATEPSAVVNGTLYGVAYSTSAKLWRLERWTGSAWQTVTGITQQSIYQPTAFNGSLYFLSLSQPDTGTNIWKFDGTTATVITTLPGYANLAATADTLYAINSGYSQTDPNEIKVYTVDDHGQDYLFTASKDVTNFSVLGDTLYLWVAGHGWNAAIYRADTTGEGLVKVLMSPFSVNATLWNGALYFSGSDGKADGIYRFDGTTITPVDLGSLLTSEYWLPGIGTYDGDLYFTTDTHNTKSTLYRYDGDTVSRIGLVGGTGASTFSYVEFDGALFLAAETETGPVATWFYDVHGVAGTRVTTATPTISGTAKAGDTLTAVPGAWTPTATLTYRWKRNGSPIAGATGPTYKVPGGDVAHTLSVTVTGAAVDMTAAASTSAATRSVATGTIALTAAISGTAASGSTLTATTPGLTPATARLTYRWYRSGSPIAKATGRAYRLTSADRGRTVSVAVYASATGYAAAKTMSPAKHVG